MCCNAYGVQFFLPLPFLLRCRLSFHCKKMQFVFGAFFLSQFRSAKGAIPTGSEWSGEGSASPLCFPGFVLDSVQPQIHKWTLQSCYAGQHVNLSPTDANFQVNINN